MAGKNTAYNGQFGKMSGVSPQKKQYKLVTSYPAASSVNPATSPSRWDVVRHPADSAVRKWTEKE